MENFEVVVIRHWRGYWKESACPLTVNVPPGGYLITFHKGNNPAHKAEHYGSVKEIRTKYQQYAWIPPMCGDTDDVVLVGV